MIKKILNGTVYKNFVYIFISNYVQGSLNSCPKCPSSTRKNFNMPLNDVKAWYPVKKLLMQTEGQVTTLLSNLRISKNNKTSHCFCCGLYTLFYSNKASYFSPDSVVIDIYSRQAWFQKTFCGLQQSRVRQREKKGNLLMTKTLVGLCPISPTCF